MGKEIEESSLVGSSDFDFSDASRSKKFTIGYYLIVLAVVMICAGMFLYPSYFVARAYIYQRNFLPKCNSEFCGVYFSKGYRNSENHLFNDTDDVYNFLQYILDYKFSKEELLLNNCSRFVLLLKKSFPVLRQKYGIQTLSLPVETVLYLQSECADKAIVLKGHAMLHGITLFLNYNFFDNPKYKMGSLLRKFVFGLDMIYPQHQYTKFINRYSEELEFAGYSTCRGEYYYVAGNNSKPLYDDYDESTPYDEPYNVTRIYNQGDYKTYSYTMVKKFLKCHSADPFYRPWSEFSPQALSGHLIKGPYITGLTLPTFKTEEFLENSPYHKRHFDINAYIDGAYLNYDQYESLLNISTFYSNVLDAEEGKCREWLYKLRDNNASVFEDFWSNETFHLIQDELMLAAFTGRAISYPIACLIHKGFRPFLTSLVEYKKAIKYAEKELAQESKNRLRFNIFPYRLQTTLFSELVQIGDYSYNYVQENPNQWPINYHFRVSEPNNDAIFEAKDIATRYLMQFKNSVNHTVSLKLKPIVRRNFKADPKDIQSVKLLNCFQYYSEEVENTGKRRRYKTSTNPSDDCGYYILSRSNMTVSLPPFSFVTMNLEIRR